MRERHYTGFSRQRAIVQMCGLLLAISAITACNNSNNNSQNAATTTPVAEASDQLSVANLLGALGERVQGASGGVQQALGPHGEVLQERTKEEVEKLFRWEYRVIDIDIETTQAAEEFEKKLSSLGDDGWECFDLAPTAKGTRATCKRRPRSALAYLKFIPGL